MTISIREAEFRDLDQICQLLIMLFEQEADFKPNYESQKNGVEQILSNPDIGRCFVIEKSNLIVGTASLLFSVSTALGGKIAVLEDFIIHQKMRNQGLGSHLLKRVISIAKELGCLRITVLTDIDNLLAQELYKKFGFRQSKMKPFRLEL